jgi:hypothetical protein
MQANTVNLAGKRQPCPCHVCAFFMSKEDEYSVLLPFMAEGIAAGDKCINIIDKRHRGERVGNLIGAGVDVAATERSGQLDITPWEQAHIVRGHFDQDAMLAYLDTQASAAQEHYPKTRLWSNQEWALEELPGVEDILEYEARFNYVWPKYYDTTVCVYDMNKFSAALLMQVLRSHPFVIIGGILRENAFYVPPDELLKELRANRFPRAAMAARPAGAN